MTMGVSKYAAILAVMASAAYGSALPLDVNSTNSIKEAASALTYNMLKTYYVGNVTASQIGLLPKPYYWWESGAMFGGLVDYYAYTGDDTYAGEVGKAIASQASPTVDFMMHNQEFDDGNDDQAFWALSAMSALEENLPIPSGSPPNLWYELCVNSFNDFVGRWNTTQCNGGLKWQIFTSNKGYDYKSSIANTAFMQLAARLARYTKNETYADWAEKSFSWLEGVGFINTTTWYVNDGAGDLQNCSAIDQAHWTYNAATSIYASAVMLNITGGQEWEERLNGLVGTASKAFFGPASNATGIMYEAQCEPSNSCDNDQYSFKAYLSRWMGKSALLLPSLGPKIEPLLTASAQAAAKACSGNLNYTCGTKWYINGFDGVYGLGQYLSAIETIQSLLVFKGVVKLPGTAEGVNWGIQLPAKKNQADRDGPRLGDVISNH